MILRLSFNFSTFGVNEDVLEELRDVSLVYFPLKLSVWTKPYNAEKLVFIFFIHILTTINQRLEYTVVACNIAKLSRNLLKLKCFAQ